MGFDPSPNHLSLCSKTAQVLEDSQTGSNPTPVGSLSAQGNWVQPVQLREPISLSPLKMQQQLALQRGE